MCTFHLVLAQSHTSKNPFFILKKFMKFTPEQITHLATIANIEIPNENRENVMKELEKIVNWVEQLKKVDTSTLHTQTIVTSEKNKFSTNKPQKPLSIQKALLNAPVHDGAYFHIPPVSKET